MDVSRQETERPSGGEDEKTVGGNNGCGEGGGVTVEEAGDRV